MYTEDEQYLLNKWVTGQETKRMGRMTTVTWFVLKDGTEVVGSVLAIDPDQYDPDAEQILASKDALRNVSERESAEIDAANVWF